MLWSGSRWGAAVEGGLERGGDSREGVPRPRARRGVLRCSATPSSEMEVRSRATRGGGSVVH
jgi:hypothetical protein